MMKDQTNIANIECLFIDTITGFDLSTKDGYEDMWAKFGSVIGWKYLKAMHLNDSKGVVIVIKCSGPLTFVLKKVIHSQGVCLTCLGLSGQFYR